MPGLELVVSRQHLSCPRELGGIEISHIDDSFFIDGVEVPKHRVEKFIRQIPNSKVQTRYIKI